MWDKRTQKHRQMTSGTRMQRRAWWMLHAHVFGEGWTECILMNMSVINSRKSNNAHTLFYGTMVCQHGECNWRCRHSYLYWSKEIAKFLLPSQTHSILYCKGISYLCFPTSRPDYIVGRLQPLSKVEKSSFIWLVSGLSFELAVI